MKIAIYFENQEIQGGAFNYSLNILSKLQKEEFKKYLIVLISDNKESFQFLASKGYKVQLIRKNIVSRVYDFLVTIKWIKKIFYKFKIFNRLESFLINQNINFIIFPTGSSSPFSLQRTNYVTTLLDICHIEYPIFPEINDNNNFFSKEFFIRKCISKSVFTFTVSQELKEKAERYYPFLKDKLFVMPLSVDHLVFNKQDFVINNFKKKYIFYPANYSAHKNHVSILKSLKYLKDHNNKTINLICCGHNKGNLKYLRLKTKEFDLQEQVTFYGFQTKEQVDNLYNNCDAVIFLSLFGPVNIPPLESWYYKKALVCNREFKAQVKDAAILVDPLDYKDIAKGINKLDELGLTQDLINKGTANLKDLEEESHNYTVELLKKVEEYRIKKDLWGSYEN